jgi:hypothetical protein
VVKDVEAGREYIEAYVQFFKVAEKAVDGAELISGLKKTDTIKQIILIL